MEEIEILQFMLKNVQFILSHFKRNFYYDIMSIYEMYPYKLTFYPDLTPFL